MKLKAAAGVVALTIIWTVPAWAQIRFRPIIMTSFAFILGVLPLVFATGAGAAGRISLGLTVSTGMLANTLLAVVFVPSFFVVLQTLEERLRKSKKVPVPQPAGE